MRRPWAVATRGLGGPIRRRDGARPHTKIHHLDQLAADRFGLRCSSAYTGGCSIELWDPAPLSRPLHARRRVGIGYAREAGSNPAISAPFTLTVTVLV
jgi:hypothetical protein